MAGREDDDGMGDAPATARAPRAPGSRSLESDESAELLMERLLDKLRLLGYEAQFARAKRPHWKLLSRTYFAFPAATTNANEQFFYFTSLVGWLLGLAGRSFTPPNQYDDPNVSCNNLLAELVKAGFPQPSFPALKLRQGYGEQVCGVLDALTDLVLFEKRGFQWRLPQYPAADAAEESEEVEDDGLEMGDMGDEMQPAADDDEEEEEAFMGAARAPEPHPGGAYGAGGDRDAHPAAPAPILESTVDPAAWAVELERVAPQLRVVLVADTKDWRSHMDKIREHRTAIAKGLPDSKAQLQTVEAEASAMLEKLQTRERFINAQLESFAARYREEKQRQQALEETYTQKSEEVANLTNELARVSKKLEEVKTEMNERGDNISDTSPLLRVSTAIKQLDTELRQMEIRIGVAQLRLTKFGLKRVEENIGRRANGGRGFGGEDDDEGL